MILIEINEDSGVTHYDALDLKREELADLEPKKITELVQDAAKKSKKRHNLAAQRGDKEAEEAMDKINQALMILKTPAERAKYDQELEGGKALTSAVLRIQPAAAPFFRDRNARFRAVEQFFRQSGWRQPASFEAQGKL